MTATRSSGKTKNSNYRQPIAIVFSVFGFLMFLGVGYLFQLVNDSSAFPIKRISVDGDFIHLDPAHVSALVSKTIDGGFFNLDVDRIREVVSDHPWIHDVSIRRVWPDSITVSIHEQQPVARWGTQALLNDGADIFAPESETIPNTLPGLFGPVGTEASVLGRYKRFKQLLADDGIQIAELHLSERRSWTIVTTDSVRLIIGRRNVAERLSRLKYALNGGLKEKWSLIDQVDLRYTNGLTISERERLASPADGKKATVGAAKTNG